MSPHDVRIHINREKYNSPDPTTGEALYALGNVPKHQELFREVSGDEEDVLIPRDGTVFNLTEDEHFYSQKVVTLVVNAKKHSWEETRIDFDQAVKLAYLRGRTLRFASFDSSRLYNVNFIGADLSNADFADTRLQGAQLDHANLSGANLNLAHLQGAALYEANLVKADIKNAFLQATQLGEANLKGANLSGTQMQGADLSGADLTDADLSNANLSGVVLSDAKLAGATIRSNTELGLADLSATEFGDRKGPLSFSVSAGNAFVDASEVIPPVLAPNKVTTDKAAYYPLLADYLRKVLIPQGPNYADGVANWLISNEPEDQGNPKYSVVSCALLAGAGAGEFNLSPDYKDGLRGFAGTDCKSASVTAPGHGLGAQP